MVAIAPTISDIADQSIDEDMALPAIAFQIGDEDTALELLGLWVESTDTRLLPLRNIDILGAGATRSLSLVPASS